MEDNLIYKSNDIIEASYALTLNEQRLLLACISQVNSVGEINDSYVISVEQARDLFYNKSVKDQAYRDLKRASEHLYERKIKMLSANGKRTRLTRWVSTVEFDDDEQTATLYFHDQIKPYISQLKANFTKYRLKNVTQLTSVYAIRIYELIVSWYAQNQSYKEFKIDDFKDLLQIGDKYRQLGELKRFVVTPAVTQINEFTDFELEISFRKVGRSYKYIQLRYNQKPEHRISEEARSKRTAHNLTKAEQKDKVMQKQRLKAEFEAFEKSIVITEGMTFQNVQTGVIYTVDENQSIMTNDFKSVNKYFLAEEHIKKLIFAKKIYQITNPEDSNTKSLL